MTSVSTLHCSFSLGCKRPKIKDESHSISVFSSHTRIPSTDSRFRLGHAVRLNTRPGLAIVFALNAKSSEQDSPKENVEDGEAETGEGQGPPLLTILAGFIVFLLVCLAVGSIISWLISLIVNVPSP
eukprot:TRINITY_DN11854_c0_g2_i1.p1 TRINITY_DN11854_c0_g2~~TRINITY_DN11854_c0_g2_i1.p1  ORF type:complete len:141 (-),score=9.39 TRINITY_DN11854_c0_g2_i1:85-465(-)